MDEIKSTEKRIISGLPQRSALSPVIYNISISDIPREEGHTKTYIYADDTAKTTTSRKANQTANYLQQDIEEPEKWVKKWKIGINTENTQATTIGRKTKQDKPARDLIE